MVPRISLFQWTSHRGRSFSRTSSSYKLTDLSASVSYLGATSSPVRLVNSARTASANSRSWAQYNTTRDGADLQPSTETTPADARRKERRFYGVDPKTIPA